MRMVRGESLRATVQPEVFPLAEQLVEKPVQMERYDQDKWIILGHANREKRYQGEQPRPKTNNHTYSIPVFSGYSEKTQSVLSVRKDPWTHQADPGSWLVVEHNLVTGKYIVPGILASSVDAANQLWLQLAPHNLGNWAPGKHPALHARRPEQLRITGRLDQDYHLLKAQYQAGHAPAVNYEDIEALEAMIVLIQRLRQVSEEALRPEVDQEMLIGSRGVAYAEMLEMAS